MTKKEQEKEPRKRSEIGKRKSLKLKEEKSSKSKEGCAREKERSYIEMGRKVKRRWSKKGYG